MKPQVLTVDDDTGVRYTLREILESADIEAFERGILARELRDAECNRSETARRLGIGRVTLLDKVKKYRLEWGAL